MFYLSVVDNFIVNNVPCLPYYFPVFLYTIGPQTLNGRIIRIVAVPYFPYMDYNRDVDKMSTRAVPRDSLDLRIITTFASKLNFT